MTHKLHISYLLLKKTYCLKSIPNQSVKATKNTYIWTIINNKTPEEMKDFKTTLFLSILLWGQLSNAQSITPNTGNWILIPEIVQDSKSDINLSNALLQGNEFTGTSTLDASSSRTFTFRLPSITNGGMMTYSMASDISNVTVASYVSTNGTNWTLLNNSNYHNGRGDDLQKVDLPASTSTNWVRIVFANNGGSKNLKEVGLYKFNTSGKNQYFLTVGASLTESSGGHSEWKNTIKERINSSLSPVVFNWSIGGDNTAGLSDKIDGYLSNHPKADYVMIEIGGNDISQNRPLTLAGSQGSTYATMKSQMRSIVQKVVNAGKIPVISRISFRNYVAFTNWQGVFQPAVNGGLNQEHGSLPYNMDIDTIIKQYSPHFWNESEQRGYLDWYQLTLNNQSWLLGSDGTHFYGSTAFHIRDFWVDYAYKYIYTGQRSPVVPYTQVVSDIVTRATNAVILAEANASPTNCWNAKILAEQIANTATRLELFNRIKTAESVSSTPKITLQPISQIVAEGSNAQFSVVATSATPITYQWYRNNTLITGATSSTLTVYGTLANNWVRYKCTLANSAGNTNSAEVTLTVTPQYSAPVFTQNPSNTTVVLGSAATFSTVVTSSSTTTYQWYKNGTAISGAITSSYTYTPTIADNGAAFYCIATNLGGPATSSSASLTVTTTSPTGGLTARYYKDVYANVSGTATLTRTDPDINFSFGANAPHPSISANAFGAKWTGSINPTVTGNYTFYSLSDDGVRLYINNQLVIDKWLYQGLTEWTGNIALIAGTSYSFRMEYFEGNGDATCRLFWSTTGIAKQVVPSAVFLPEGVSPSNIPPSISSPPAHLTVTEGQVASFTVTASGSNPLAYQWLKNGTNIPSATSNSYSFTTTLADSGMTFSCRVSNTAGTVSSTSANLSVKKIVLPPTIISNPSNLVLTVGDTASFVITATGSNPLAYQWLKNGSNVSGATSNTLRFIPSMADSGATYVCIVSNTAGTANSLPALLSVNPSIVSPEILSEPTDLDVIEGQMASFQITVSGSFPLVYEWYKDGIKITGTNSSTLSFIASKLHSNTVYRCVVSNSAGSDTSTTASLSVKTLLVAPSILSQPINQTILEGQTAILSLAAYGIPSVSYQWYKNDQPILGEISNSLSIETVLADSNSTFYCTVYNTLDTITSSVVWLHVIPLVPAHIVTQANPTTVIEGNTATFTIFASGTPTPIYQWYKNGIAVAGANTNIYSYVPALADSGSVLMCIVTNLAGSDTSIPVMITVKKLIIATVITQHPSNASVSSGTLVSFSITATGTDPLAYQWYKNGLEVSGANSSSISFTATQADNGSTYYCTVTNAANSISSSTAVLTINSNGITARYYTNSLASIPAVATITRLEQNINFSWLAASPDPSITTNRFSARFTGKIKVATTGTYTFYSQSDDGSKLWINNQLVIDKWLYQALSEWTGSIVLTAGMSYDFRMEYFEANGDATCKLLYSASGIAKQIVPTTCFTPEGSSARFEEEELSEQENAATIVYPHPTHDAFVYTLPDSKINHDIHTLLMYDTKGTLVYSKEIAIQPNQTELNIETSSLPKGVYIVSFGENKVKIIK
jgi:lysophospholipase L1-like esterase